ncbi:unnamed protein product [Spirodela intermedia]|uniref:Uncharacterized protein n=1 Tax=Spirodela intermedia TaxID=51605 RepID=A0A7I8IJP0_SPIIN|nr:unnamed protein product [Spirodela intermedia]CAA6657175.1 unnamed protein product [Spirodela intermedia]CAA6675731.1 unnamed protein product [Spirodela intermedia]
MLEQLQWVRQTRWEQEMNVGVVLTRLTNNVICGMTMGRRCSGTDGKTVAIISTPNVADYVGIREKLDLQHLKTRYVDVRRRFDTLRTKESGKTVAGGVVRGFLRVLHDISEDQGAEMMFTGDNFRSFIDVTSTTPPSPSSSAFHRHSTVLLATGFHVPLSLAVLSTEDLFMAGSDTTSTTMERALAELINKPGIQQDARRAIDSVVGESRLVEESDIQNLPFLQAIVKETLRLHPAVPILRDRNVWAIGRDPTQWRNPLEFRPERFTPKGRSFGIDVRDQHYHLLPFGSGRRRCPGLSLVLQLIHTTLANVIHCFNLSVEGGLVDMTEGHGATFSKAHPLVCTPKAGLNSVLSTPIIIKQLIPFSVIITKR